MMTDAGDAGRMTAKRRAQIEDVAAGYYKDCHFKVGDGFRDCFAHIDAQSRQLAAYQAATGFLVRQGLVFVNQGGYTECLACGAVRYQGAIHHMPDCEAEALRALVAGEGE